jgi:hypothetical protein
MSGIIASLIKTCLLEILEDSDLGFYFSQINGNSPSTFPKKTNKTRVKTDNNRWFNFIISKMPAKLN